MFEFIERLFQDNSGFVTRENGSYDLSIFDMRRIQNYRCMLQELETCMGDLYTQSNEARIINYEIDKIFSVARRRIVKNDMMISFPRHAAKYTLECNLDQIFNEQKNTNEKVDELSKNP